MHRGDQYVRAIRLYYRKTHTYPGSIEQLEKTNNIRFLRQQYMDPMTGKDDWRLIHVGEAKTTVKGFFGQPLAGLTPGLGSAAGMASGGGIGGGCGRFGAAGGLGECVWGLGVWEFFAGWGRVGGFGWFDDAYAWRVEFEWHACAGWRHWFERAGYAGRFVFGGFEYSGSVEYAGVGEWDHQSAGTPSGGAPFVGVGIPKEGDSITVLNEQTTYNTWEFMYDPRIEQLYAKGSLFGGSGSLGSASGNSSGFGNTPGSGTAPSGFGNTPSGFGASPGTASPTTPDYSAD